MGRIRSSPSSPLMATTGSYSRAIGRSIPPSIAVPPMPLLHRKLAVHSVSSSLVLRPYDATQRGLYAGQAVHIPWGTVKPEAVQDWREEADGDGLVVDGLAGILEGFQRSCTPALSLAGFRLTQ